MMVMGVQEKRVRKQRAYGIEIKTKDTKTVMWSVWRMEDLIYQVDECKAEKHKKKCNVVPYGRGMSRGVRVYLSASVCVRVCVVQNILGL